MIQTTLAHLHAAGALVETKVHIPDDDVQVAFSSRTFGYLLGISRTASFVPATFLPTHAPLKYLHLLAKPEHGWYYQDNGLRVRRYYAKGESMPVH